MDTAIFSPSSLFGPDSDDDRSDTIEKENEEMSEDATSMQQLYVERKHSFPAGIDLIIREFSFHHLNANLLWPGSFAFSQWIIHNQSLLQGQKILELGSGTGALAIFLRKSFGADITTSDYDDLVVEENIAYNCKINKLPVMSHIRHSWGENFPVAEPYWDLIIASDILLYVKQYQKLIKTLCFLLRLYNPKGTKESPENKQLIKTVTIAGKQIELQKPYFLMSWRRRIGSDENIFFAGCADAGLEVQHVGSRVYIISPKRTPAITTGDNDHVFTN